MEDPRSLETRNWLPSGLLLLVTGEKSQQVAVPHSPCTQACPRGGPTEDTVTGTKQQRLKWHCSPFQELCLPEVLRGSSISFCNDALFVDKSKLTMIKKKACGGEFCWPFSDWIWPQSRILAVAEMMDYCNDCQKGLLACLNGNKFHQEEGNFATLDQ